MDNFVVELREAEYAPLTTSKHLEKLKRLFRAYGISIFLRSALLITPISICFKKSLKSFVLFLRIKPKLEES